MRRAMGRLDSGVILRVHVNNLVQIPLRKIGIVDTGNSETTPIPRRAELAEAGRAC